MKAAFGVCLATLLIGCSSRPSSGVDMVFPHLDEAARARLVALSSGWMNGNPDLAASLSASDVAVRDRASAQALAVQEAAGDPMDFAFDVLSVASHPLDGGATDFIAFEKARFHDTGVVSNIVELYRREGASRRWKAVQRAIFANNIDLPNLRLGPNGSAHLLSPEEAMKDHAQPDDLVMRYAIAVSQQSGRLPSGTFAPGEYTTGEVSDATSYVAAASDHGFGSRRWESRPGGAAVALTNGVLIFGSLQRVQTLHHNTEGTSKYFSVQDSKRLNYGGLLEPGHYSDLTVTSSATVAFVVTAHGLPDVVGRDIQVLSVDGRRTS